MTVAQLQRLLKTAEKQNYEAGNSAKGRSLAALAEALEPAQALTVDQLVKALSRK